MPQHNRIIDEYTCRTDLSRQEKYQLRAIRDQRCRQCGSKAELSTRFCTPCRQKQLQRVRDATARQRNSTPQDLI